MTELLQSCPGVTRSTALLLALKGAVLSLALGPRSPSGAVVRPVVQYLLAAWREEEAMYRIRTLPGEDENSELFVDLVQEE